MAFHDCGDIYGTKIKYGNLIKNLTKNLILTMGTTRAASQLWQTY